MSFTKMHLYFDDVQVGQSWESLGRTVTEADIVNYACLSGDFNPIHVDHEFAKTTGYRRPIAHGLLIQAIISGLGIRDWQFKGPVYAGDTMVLKTSVLEKEERARGRRGIITWLRQVFNQEGKIVQEGITVTLVEGRASLKPEAKDQQVKAMEEQVSSDS